MRSANGLQPTRAAPVGLGLGYGKPSERQSVLRRSVGLGIGQHRQALPSV